MQHFGVPSAFRSSPCRSEHLLANDERTDSRARHAPRAGSDRLISPAAVAVLRLDEMFDGQLPSFPFDFDAGDGGFAQAEDGELRIAVVNTGVEFGRKATYPKLGRR